MLAGIFGIVGSIILAVPLIGETIDRKHWDKLQDIRRRAAETLSAQEKEELREVRDQFLDERLGDYERHRHITIWGVFALGVAFLLLVIHAGFGSNG